MSRKTAAIAIALTALTAGIAGYQIVGAEARTEIATAKSFVTPRIDGRRLDIRYTIRQPADPVMTAERFCRSQGFDTVVGYSIQPASATRTIGDFAAQNGALASLRAFYAIRCDGAADETSIALR